MYKNIAKRTHITIATDICVLFAMFYEGSYMLLTNKAQGYILG